MILTDGSTSTDQMQPNLKCQWLISPNVKPVGSVNFDEGDDNLHDVEAVVLVFPRMDIYGGEITIRSGPTPSSPIFWSCVDCSTAPEKLTIPSPAVYVEFSTESYTEVNTGTGFELHYHTLFADNRGMGDGIETSGAPFASSFMPPLSTLLPSPSMPINFDYLMRIHVRRRASEANEL